MDGSNDACMVGSVDSGLLELAHFFLLAKQRDVGAFQSFSDLLPEGFDPTAQQKDVIEAFLVEFVDIPDSFLLVEMVHDDDLVLFVLVGVQLRDELVPFDVGAWEVQRLFYVVLLVFVGFAEVDQHEVGLDAHWQLLGADGHGGEVGHLAPGVIFGLVPVVH